MATTVYKTLRPNFVAGTLVAVSATELIVQLPPGYAMATVPVQFAANTQICRRHCQASWEDLKLGDRIESATFSGPNDLRTANWIDVNLLAGFGMITHLQGNQVTIEPANHYGYARTLLIEPTTTTRMFDGSQFLGRADPLTIGDNIYYTATSDTLSHATPIAWALLIAEVKTPLQMASPSAPVS